MRSIKKATSKIVAVLLTVIIVAVGMPFTAVATNSIAPPTYVTSSSEKALWAEGTNAETTNNIDAIKWYKNNNNIYYWFLPSSADLSNLTVYHNFDSVKINDIAIISGNSYNMFENNQTYTVIADGTAYTLCVQKTNGIGSMFLTTESGTMRNIHNDKSVSESGQLVAIDYDGSISYDNELDSIKGRGNTTWKLSKKPYNIKLAKKTSLLGMDKNKKWCLLANAQEHSMIRNVFMYDLANEVGLDFSPESRFVDLYTNGEYKGTYQLTQKVEAGDGDLVDITDLEANTEDAVALGTGTDDVDLEKMYGNKKYNFNNRRGFRIPYNPDDITGGYLMEFVVSVDEPSSFTTKGGQNVNVKAPEYCSVDQINYIANFMQELEDALYSSTGYNSKGKHYTEYIDIKSAAIMYLLQEFSVNVDGGISSCYFYKDSDLVGDGKVHASPCWDFDVALGNLNQYKDFSHTMNYSDWFIKYSFRYSDTLTIFAQLCNHDDFWAEVEKIWTEKFVPALDIATGKTEGTGRLQSIYDYDALLESASVMNYTRWDLKATLLVKESGYTQDEQMKYLEKFINGRIKFLNSNLTFAGEKEKYIEYLNSDLEYFNEYYSQDIPEEKTALEEITAIIEQAKVDISNVTSKEELVNIMNAVSNGITECAVFTIYFDNSKAKWDNVYIYCWSYDYTDESGNIHEGSVPAEWPGTKMTHIGNDIYKFIQKGYSPILDNIIFTNGESEDSGNKRQTYTTHYYNNYDSNTSTYIAQPTIAEYDSSKKAYIHKGRWDQQAIRGDVNKNCDVDLMDAVLTLKHLIGVYELDEIALASADVDYNDEVELLDAVYIQKYLIGSIKEFPYFWD